MAKNANEGNRAAARDGEPTSGSSDGSAMYLCDSSTSDHYKVNDSAILVDVPFLCECRMSVGPVPAIGKYRHRLVKWEVKPDRDAIATSTLGDSALELARISCVFGSVFFLVLSTVANLGNSISIYFKSSDQGVTANGPMVRILQVFDLFWGQIRQESPFVIRFGWDWP